nr:uncharacterized protein LOC128702034 [Cherax quadricarinatus]
MESREKYSKDTYYVLGQTISHEEDLLHEFKGHRNISIHDIPSHALASAGAKERTRNAVSVYVSVLHYVLHHLFACVSQHLYVYASQHLYIYVAQHLYVYVSQHLYVYVSQHLYVLCITSPVCVCITAPVGLCTAVPLCLEDVRRLLVHRVQEHYTLKVEALQNEYKALQCLAQKHSIKILPPVHHNTDDRGTKR